MVPGEPSALTWIGLIQPRPNSVAKNCPSKDCGNFVVEVEAASYR
ncbi:hypothetical protein C5N14_25415 [Micromonospora sp. MW-13]|nr:hypothetical protein C5N14_25415 [Micromonospora sp. MW-13]